MATARRSRFYLVRAFYAAVLFMILWGVHAAWTSETGGELPSKMVSWFAFSTFCGITIGQEILVLVLTPALVAGVIADEKQRKTLHYLMASRLTSAEIVLGKLLVRMLYVGVLLGVSLPVLSLLVLMGGIDPRLVLLSCGATLSTGVVPGGAFDLGLDDRPAGSRGILHRLWPGMPLAVFAADLAEPYPSRPGRRSMTRAHGSPNGSAPAARWKSSGSCSTVS